MLARENSCRNPARTAVTAGALTVGLALVAFVATLGAGLRGTINDTVRQQVHADYVISADTATLSPTAAATLQGRRSVTATAIRQGQISTFGNTEQINGVDPATIARFYHFKWQSGSGAGALAALDQTGAIVSNQFATNHHLQVGDSFAVQTESSTRLELVVRGIQSTPTFGSVLGAVTINTALFDRSFTQPANSVVLADTAASHRRPSIG
jgi:putative ABC transport system permease protein